MSGQFDPYHKWLGIPPKDQPPHYYRLLGIEVFEKDADVIDAAADRVMVYLRSCGAGKHQSASQTLLNEVSRARVCLLNADKKATYDHALETKLQESAAPVAAPPRASAPPQAPAPPTNAAPVFASDDPVARFRKQGNPWILPVGIGGCGLVAAAVLAFMFLAGPPDDAPKDGDPKDGDGTKLVADAGQDSSGDGKTKDASNQDGEGSSKKGQPKSDGSSDPKNGDDPTKKTPDVPNVDPTNVVVPPSNGDPTNPANPNNGDPTNPANPNNGDPTNPNNGDPTNPNNGDPTNPNNGDPTNPNNGDP
ncbi:MAG: hypothetical protein N2C14_02635, partial [Planctomycetales bacterium]